MPRKKIHKSETARTNAYKAAKMDRIVMEIRTAAQVNKQVLQEAAEACGVSLAKFLSEAAVAYILNHDNLGEDWLEEHKNKGDG